MPHQRRIDRVVTVPPLAPGFAGPGHQASQVIPPDDFARTDPFILLMDDHLDMGERQVGGPHPHAGFETVTLLLDGAIHDADEGGRFEAGEAQWMTAGRGVVHSENVRALGPVRLLQLWLTLPRAQRWTAPGFQDVHAAQVPIRRHAGATVRIYSGESGGVRSTTRNQVPVTIVEGTLQPGAAVDQDLPGSYNGFVFVIDGALTVGDQAARLDGGQVGWLDRPGTSDASVVRISAAEHGARFVLYAGQPQGDAIVAHGPFIADTADDIRRLYAEYRAGRFVRMSELAAPARQG
jgi:redox-sensitive bicupin YhaK (pirin superfamily)